MKKIVLILLFICFNFFLQCEGCEETSPLLIIENESHQSYNQEVIVATNEDYIKIIVRDK